jgi:hypothetical protein
MKKWLREQDADLDELEAKKANYLAMIINKIQSENCEKSFIQEALSTRKGATGFNSDDDSREREAENKEQELGGTLLAKGPEAEGEDKKKDESYTEATRLLKMIQDCANKCMRRDSGSECPDDADLASVEFLATELGDSERMICNSGYKAKNLTLVFMPKGKVVMNIGAQCLVRDILRHKEKARRLQRDGVSKRERHRLAKDARRN